jgi:hypothetical protein
VQLATLEQFDAPFMQAFGWSSANQAAHHGVDGRDKPGHDERDGLGLTV